MRIESLIPVPKARVHFSLAFYKSVPKESGCYVLTNLDGDILYIGLSVNLFTRFQQHLDNQEKTGPTLGGKSFWFYFMHFDKTNLEKLERTWMKQFTGEHGRRPMLNKVDSPIT